MTSIKLRIGIVGGGIGGLTAGVALVRDGHDVTCFEKTSTLREVGAGIQLTPNATRLLIRLGLGDTLARIGARPRVQHFRRWQDGSVLGRRTFDPISEERWGAPRYSVHRAELHDALRSAFPADRLRLGARCVGVKQTPREAQIQLEDGSTHSTDVVIAADGIHSTLRQVLVSDSARFGGNHTFRGLVPAERVPALASDPRLDLWLGPGCSVATYPVSAGTLINFAGVFPATEERPESWTSEGRVEDVLERFDGWHEELRSLLGAADRVLILPLYDRAPIERWTEGRLALLGDAAHPMFPYMAQGAVQAIEDAIVLARCLRGQTVDAVPEALTTYAAARIARTAEIQRRAGNGDAMHLPDGDEQRQRDAFFATLPAVDTRRDWLWGYDAETGEAWDAKS